MSSSKGKNNEATGIVLFFCAIILALFFYLPADLTGNLGSFFKSIGFGFMGVSAHVIPVFIAYVAIEMFLEKRANVARIRVRTVIFLMVLVSAILASITMDFGYLKELCTDAATGKSSAFKAVQLLWKSGKSGAMITRPSETISVIPGGLLGGLIATSLEAVCGRIVTCILLFGFTFTQVILIFQISVKQTAKAISHATKKSFTNYKTNVENRGRASVHTKGILPDSVYTNPNSQYYPVNQTPVNQAPLRPSTPDGNTFIVNPGVTEVPIINSTIPLPEDPFNVHPALPVDDTTGFIDLNSDYSSNKSTINYGERELKVDSEANTADFSYTARHKNPDYRPPKPMDMYSFGPKDDGRQKEFYDLTEEPRKEVYETPSEEYEEYEDNDYPVNSYNSYASNETYENDYDDQEMPFEIEGEEDDNANISTTNVFDYSNTQSYAPVVPQQTSQNVVPAPVTNQVSVVAPVVPVAPSPAPVAPAPVEAPVASAPVVAPRDDIKITTAQPEDGISNTEGRTIDTTSSSSTPAFATENHPVKRFKGKYRPAPTSILSGDPPKKNANNNMELRAKAAQLEEALKSFGIEAKVVDITYGPAITRFELTLKTGIKVSRVLSLTDDIQLAMAAISVRIEAPIPGKSAIGIEIPNDKTTAVHLRDLLETREFKESSPLTVALGRDIPGKAILCDLAKMPHLLVAGSTGSGKSVCINSILLSILCKASPDEVKLILIDPKQVELSIYNGIPHLITPVVVDPKKATNALKWAVQEMNSRYNKFAENHVRNMDGYNEKAEATGMEKMPLILLVIDEFADIMTVAAKEVEEQVMRLAAMARAAGIHMILATQRPSVDVITGVLKNNMPSRIAFAVTSGVDSRTILDSVGAEKLLGKGDMLYAPQSAPKPIRGQGAFVKDEEVEKIIEFLRKYGTNYDDQVNSFINNVSTEGGGGVAGASGGAGDGSAEDDLLEQAVDIVIDAKVASVSILQRKLGIGYPRAARLIDVMEQNHYIGPFEGSKPRKVLINKTDWLEIKSKK